MQYSHKPRGVPTSADSEIIKMQQLYFIRHGNADYLKNCLTPYGVLQVGRLSSTLDRLLPENLEGVLVSSPSQRAVETAQGLMSLLIKKTRRTIYIDREQSLSELLSMGSIDTVLENGRWNIALINKYHGSEFGFFVSHEKIIAATCIALVKTYDLPMPDFLRLVEDQPDEETIAFFMEHMKVSREEALNKIKSYIKNPLVELPRIAEASAIHIDLDQKQIRHILPE